MKYVAPELLFAEMYLQFQHSEEMPNVRAPCVCDIYREECKRLHIRTAKLGVEECLPCDTAMGDLVLQDQADYRLARNTYQADKDG